MKSAELVIALNARAVELTVVAGRLKISAPLGELNEDDKLALKDNKDAIIAYLLEQKLNTEKTSEVEDNSPNIPVLDREVPLPRCASSGRMQRFASLLLKHGYTVENCARRLGVYPSLGVNFWTLFRATADRPSLRDGLDSIIECFVDGRPVDIDAFARTTSQEFVALMFELGLVRREANALVSWFCMLPCEGMYFATDRPEKNRAINQVMYLWGESFMLAGLVKRTARRRCFDIGTGSGVHAILASRHANTAIGADVNPRALGFARFNALLNTRENVVFVTSDIYSGLAGPCDLLVANPPYAPDAAAQPGENFWSGGANGMDLLGRIVGGLPERLEDDGIAYINALYPNPPGSSTIDHFDRWLDGGIEEWDVFDNTWPVPTYEDYFSDAPYEGDKGAWRFGVICMRRAKTHSGTWQQVAGHRLFFSDAGLCQVKLG